MDTFVQSCLKHNCFLWLKVSYQGSIIGKRLRREDLTIEKKKKTAIRCKLDLQLQIAHPRQRTATVTLERYNTISAICQSNTEQL